MYLVMIKDLPPESYQLIKLLKKKQKYVLLKINQKVQKKYDFVFKKIIYYFVYFNKLLKLIFIQSVNHDDALLTLSNV